MDDRDTARVAAWLGADLVVEHRATGGSSNVTWFVRVDGDAAVLRHPPRDRPALPTAHDLTREARVLRALAGTPVPVPRVLASCDDPSVLGVPFVINERAGGACLLHSAVAGLDATAVAHDAIDVLAEVHAADASSLDDRSAPHTQSAPTYLQRQIDRWAEQLRRTPTAPRLGPLDDVVEWLHAARPTDEARTLVHGDYGFHNLLVSATRVEAVLDWELATLGDPLADLFSFLKSWGPDARAPNPANDVVAGLPGAPSRAGLLDRYAIRTARSVRDHEAFYDAFGVWRSIGIFEGIHARSGGTRFTDETPRLVHTIRAMMAAAREQR